jgi:hypothetical protein
MLSLLNNPASIPLDSLDVRLRRYLYAIRDDKNSVRAAYLRRFVTAIHQDCQETQGSGPGGIHS